VQHVGKRLLTSWPQNESDVRPRAIEQCRDRVRRGLSVALSVQLRELCQRFTHGQEMFGESDQNPKWMKPATEMLILEQLFVSDREKSAA
jgi:hypothetical protein